MKSKIKLYFNNAYKWYKKNDLYVIGYIYYNDKLYKDSEAIDFLIENDFKKNYHKILKKIDGCFSIVFNDNDKYYIVSDMMRCFPVFYNVDSNVVNICDNIEDFRNKKINELSKKELFSCNYVTGFETIYENVYQLEGHQIVVISEKGIDRQFYYQFDFNTVKNPQLEKLDAIYDKCVKNAIKYAAGRRILLPLSGGNDSRLLAYYLVKNNYYNVLCYTYGNKFNNESKISKKVAEYLGLDWIFINYNNHSMQKKYYNKRVYEQMADYCARGYSEPLIQEWEAIDYLKRKNIINKEFVVMPGYSNDILCGSHIREGYLIKKDYGFDELINFIKKDHYIRNILSDQEIKQRVCNTLGLEEKDCSRMYSQEEIVELIETFDFKERQVKFIANAVRIHDMSGLNWVLPFWNRDLIDFWYSTLYNKRYKLKFFNQFTRYKYRDLMEYAPIYKEPYKVKKTVFQKAKYVLLRYWSGSLNLFGYFHYRDYLKYIIKYKVVHYNCYFAADYIKYIEKKYKKTV